MSYNGYKSLGPGPLTGKISAATNGKIGNMVEDSMGRYYRVYTVSGNRTYESVDTIEEVQWQRDSKFKIGDLVSSPLSGSARVESLRNQRGYYTVAHGGYGETFTARGISRLEEHGYYLVSDSTPEVKIETNDWLCACGADNEPGYPCWRCGGKEV